MGLRMYQAPQIGGLDDEDLTNSLDSGSDVDFEQVLRIMAGAMSNPDQATQQQGISTFQDLLRVGGQRYQTASDRLRAMTAQMEADPQGLQPNAPNSTDMATATRAEAQAATELRLLMSAANRANPGAAARAVQSVQYDPRPGHEEEPISMMVGSTRIPLPDLKPSPDALEVTRRTQGTQQFTDEQRRANEAHDIEMQRAKEAEAARARGAQAASDAVALQRTEITDRTNQAANAIANGRLTFEQADAERKDSLKKLELAENRLSTVIDTMTKQETNAYKGWAESQNYDKDTITVINGMIKSKNERESAEYITGVTSQTTQRGQDIDAAKNIALMAKDLYAKSLEDTFYAPENWIDAMQKGMALVAAGKSLPKDWMVGIAGPIKPPVDTSMPRREFAAMLNTDPNNPLPPRVDLAQGKPTAQAATAFPEKTPPPGQFVSQEFLGQYGSAMPDLGASLAGAEATRRGVPAPGTPNLMDMLNEGEDTGQPDTGMDLGLEQNTQPEPLPLYLTAPEAGDQMPDVTYPEMEPTDGGMEMMNAPGAVPEPDPYTNSMIELLQPVGEIASRYIGTDQSAARAGATLADLDAGDSVEEAWNNNWGDLGDEYAWNQPELDNEDYWRNQDEEENNDMNFGDLFDV